MSKKAPRLRTILGGRASTARTLILEVRAFDDATTAIQASVKALQGQQGATRAVSVATARDLLTDQRVHWFPSESGGLGSDAPTSKSPELKHALHAIAFRAMGRFAIAAVARYIAKKAC